LPKQLPPEVAETFIHYFETTYLSEENQNIYIGRTGPGYGNTNTLLEDHHSYHSYLIKKFLTLKLKR